MNDSKLFPHRLTVADVDTVYVRQLFVSALAEDTEGAGLRRLPVYTGDLTTLALGAEAVVSLAVVARQPLVVAGLPWVALLLEVYGLSERVRVELSCQDGDALSAGTEILRLQGPQGDLLTVERVLLNFLQHLSGVASLTAQYVGAMGETATRLLDTRKTTPAYRVLEKYAVVCGGGYNHRLGLFDQIMFKDNHVASLDDGSLQALVVAAKKRFPGIWVEVEVDDLSPLPALLDAPVDMVLLDNFSLADLGKAVDLVQGAFVLEASGGVTVETVGDIAQVGVDFISCGALTHQSVWPDIGMDWV